MNRRYFIIAANSFTTNIASFLDEGQTGDGSSIFVNGTYVGWFGNSSGSAVSGRDGYLTNNGPLADYTIDRAYQNYETMAPDDEISFQIWGKNVYGTTTVDALDDARIAHEAGQASTLVVTFTEQTAP